MVPAHGTLQGQVEWVAPPPAADSISTVGATDHLVFRWSILSLVPQRRNLATPALQQSSVMTPLSTHEIEVAEPSRPPCWCNVRCMAKCDGMALVQPSGELRAAAEYLRRSQRVLWGRTDAGVPRDVHRTHVP